MPPTLDMRPDGTFRVPPAQPMTPATLKLLVGAFLVASVAGAVAVAAFAIWVLSMALPVLLVAGAVVWGTVKFRRWQLLRGGGRTIRPF